MELYRKQQREQIRPMLEEKIGVTKDTQFTMLLIHPDSMASESYGELRKELENQMEALCMENYYMLLRPGEQGGIYVVLVDTERNRTLKRIFELRIMPKIQDITACVATMKRFEGISQLPDTMNELSALLEHTFCTGHEVIMTEKMAQMMEYEKLDYPTAMENEMVQDIRSGKKEKITEAGKAFSEQVILSRATPECIRNYTLRFLMGIALRGRRDAGGCQSGRRTAIYDGKHPEQPYTERTTVSVSESCKSGNCLGMKKTKKKLRKMALY